MKIRNNMRITALVLALVMLLPLISIPVFADETEAPAVSLFSENFDGKTIDDVAASKAKSAIITTAAGKAAGDDALQLTVAGVGAADYYLWEKQNNKWPITEATITDGKISGKTEKGDVTDAELPANDDDDTKSTTVGGVSYKVVTGAYADSMGGFTNVAAATKFKNPAITVADHGKITVELDIYLSEGLKNSSGISGRMQGTKVEGGNQNIELFEIKANGTTATISKHENATISKGEAKTVALGAWVNLIFELDFTAKHVTLLVNEEFAFRTSGLANTYADVASVNADSLQVQIDRGAKPSTNAGTVQFDNVSIVDGLSGISYNPNQIKPVHVDFENFEVGADPSSALAGNGGLTGLKVSDKYGSKAMEITFERPGSDNKLNVDKNPKIKNPAVSYDSHDKVVHEVSYFFPTDAEGQIQNQFTSSTAKVDGVETSISWVDVYQIAFKGGTATLKFETGTDSTMQDIFAKTGRYADNHKSYMFATGKWNTVSLVIDLDTGIYEVYLNGELIFDDVQVYRNGVCTDITIAANQFITGGKVNKVTGAGTFYIDDLKFFEGTAPSVEPVEKTVEDFSDYRYILGQTAPGLSVPKLATVETFADTDNVVVKLPMAAVHTEGYALLRADGRKALSFDVEITETDEEDETIPTLIYVPATEEEYEVKLDEDKNLYFAYFTDKEGMEWNVNDNFLDPADESLTAYENYYLVPASVAEIATGSQSGQIAKAFKVLHNKFTYADTDTVVLSADYFIEENSKGIIEAQFEAYKYDVVEDVEGVPTTVTKDGGWIQLYYFDLETGRFEGLDEYMTIGAWNNVKVFMNLKTGECELYLNDALVKTENVGNTNVTIGLDAVTSFSVAKIQRTTSMDSTIAGNLYIDNVSVSDKVPADSQYGDGFLSDEAFINNLSNILVTVKDPSIRLENPNGIRFATKINKAFYAQALAALGEDAFVGMGTLIAPLDYVQKAGAFTKEALGAIEADTEAKYLDIPFAEFFDGAEGVAFGEDELVFTASIVNIKEENLMRDFAAVAYITLKLPDGSTRTYYAKAYAVSNAAYEAKYVLANSETIDWTEAELAVLNSYAAADVENKIEIDSPVGNSKAPEAIWGEGGSYTLEDRKFFYAYWAGMGLTITGPEGFELYIVDAEGNITTVASVNGVITIESVETSDYMPFTFGLSLAGDYVLETTYPEGSMMNPIEITDIANSITANVPEAGEVYYSWTANKTGVLAITGATANGSIRATNFANYVQATVEGTATAYLFVSAGDEVEIVVSTLAPASDDPYAYVPAPAGEVSFTLALDETTVEISPVFGENDSATLTFNADPAKPIIYAAYGLGGKAFTLENATGIVIICNGTTFYPDLETGALSVTFEGTPRDQIVFAVIANVEEAKEITVDLTAAPEEIPEGVVLVVGDNTVSVDGSNWDGTTTNFTAAEDGTYIFTAGDNAIVIYDYTNYFPGETFQLALTAGQTVTLQVATADYSSADVIVNVAKKAVIADGEVEGGVTEATMTFVIPTASYSKSDAQTMIIGAAGSYVISVAAEVPANVWVQIHTPTGESEWTRIDGSLPFTVEKAAGDELTIRVYNFGAATEVGGTEITVSVAKAEA